MNCTEENTSAFLKYLINNGGPEPKDYDKFTSLVNGLDQADVDEFRKEIETILNENTLIGHGYVKPYGYPGDFTLIDKIYQFDVNEDSRYKNWDLFFQNQPGASAVRNRKDFFMEYCRKMVLRNENAKILILGSGPASDVYEFLSSISGGSVLTLH